MRHNFDPVGILALLQVTLVASAYSQEAIRQPQVTVLQDQSLQNVSDIAEGLDSLLMARKLLLDGDIVAIARSAQQWYQSVPYLQASSLPMRVYECVRDSSLLRCMKLYVLQRLEGGRQPDDIHSKHNLRQVFMDQLFGDDTQQMDSLIKGEYAVLSETELNTRLRKNFERLFAHRELKLKHLLPGIVVNVVPSKSGKLQFSLKKSKEKRGHGSGRAATKSDEMDETLNSGGPDDIPMVMSMSGNMKKPGGGGIPSRVKNKMKTNSYKQAILQLAVPVMVLPAVLMGSFLPFILPILKMATIMTLMLNNGAFLAALIYAARTHANSQDEPQHISYGHPGFH